MKDECKEKFTSGKWKYSTDNGGYLDSYHFKSNNELRIETIGEIYDKADGCLCAAAPELYEALENLMSAMDDVLCNADRIPDCIVWVVQEAQDKATAALKKARGEE